MRYKQINPIFIGLALCLAGALVGLAYYALAQPKYMARIAFAPVDEDNDTQKIPGSLGVLAGLAGMSDQASDVHNQFLFQLTSYETARNLLDDRKIIEGLEARKKITRPYTADDIQNYITKNLQFDKPRGGLLAKSPLTILVIKDKDPQFASYMLDRVISESDAVVKSRRMIELEGRRDNIVATLKSVSTMEYREALIRVLAQIERERLFGGVNKYYSFRVVDPIMQSAKPVDPTLLLSVGIGAFIGFVLAAIFLVFWFLRISTVRPADA